MNNEINQIATDMNNLASDTQQAGTGIGQSSPNINLNAERKDYTMEKKHEVGDRYRFDKKEKWDNKTHGDIMSDTQKYESEIDSINEMQELFRKGDIMGGLKIAKNLNFNLEDYFKEGDIQTMFPDGKANISQLADFFDPRKSELLNSIKELKEHNNFDNRTDEQKREDQLLKDQREREDTVAQRGTQDMLKAGLHPASANYGGSIGGSSGGGGGGGSSESEKEKERRRRRKKYLEEKRREREREKRQNVMNILSRMGSAATYGGMRAALFRPKSMNNVITTGNTGTTTKSFNNKVEIDRPEWLDAEIEDINNWGKNGTEPIKKTYEMYSNPNMSKEERKKLWAENDKKYKAPNTTDWTIDELIEMGIAPRRKK